MGNSISDNSLLKQLAERDEQAARRLFERYSRRLSELAEQHISTRLGTRLDGEDVVQSVFRTFFRRGAGGEFQVDPSGNLWCLLVAITLTKVRRQARWHQAAKRDVTTEQAQPTGDWAEEMLAREPGPAEAVVLWDQVESVLKNLPETYARIFTMRLEGQTRSEIAEQLGISRQTVHRALTTMQKRMQCLEDDPLQ